MALSFAEASRRYKQKFPAKSLVTFDGTTRPCLILCETHGDVRATSFKSVMESRHGCPTCGTLASRENRVARLTGMRDAEKESQKRIHDTIISAVTKTKALKSIPNLSSEELLKRLEEISTELELAVELSETHIEAGYKVVPVDLEGILPG